MSRDAIRQTSTPNPPYPSNAGREGGEAYDALSNNVYATQHATGSATAGTMFLTLGIQFTPKVSGKILVLWAASGTGANATAGAQFQPSVGGATAGIPLMPAVAEGDAAHSLSTGGQFIFTGLPLNVQTNLNVAYTSASGITLPNGAGSMEIIELPA